MNVSSPTTWRLDDDNFSDRVRIRLIESLPSGGSTPQTWRVR